MEHATIPAHCPSCGAVFKSRAIAFSGNASNIYLEGNIETCPFCGGMANIADGVFNIVDNVLSVVSAPNITKQMLEALNVVVRNAYEGKSTANEAQEAASQIDPELGALVEKIFRAKSFKKVGLLLLLLAISRCSVNINLDANQLIEQITGKPPVEIIQMQEPNKDYQNKKPSRNQPCPCDSGKRFKHCHGKLV